MSPIDEPPSGRGDRTLARVLGWLVGTALVMFFLLLGFWQSLAEIPSYAIGEFSARILKGGSPIGFKLAYLGTILLVVGQTYTLRKAVMMNPLRRGIGSGRSWLGAHCCLDIVGSVLLLIHSGFPLSFKYANPIGYLRPSWGLIGLAGIQGFAAWLVLVTLVSGLVGEQLRVSVGRGGLLRPWLRVHIVLTCLLFFCGIFHLYIVLWLKYLSAG